MLKRSRGAAAAALLCLSVLAACGDDDPESSGDDSAQDVTSDFELPDNPAGADCTYTPGGEAARPVEVPPAKAAYSEPVEVTITTTAGDITATLDASATPCTVSSFMSLASQGFYDDTPCPRVTDQGIYVLQCGDPTGTTGGGPGYSFADELTGKETYGPGTLAMANGGPDTNGSQFFVVYEESGLSPDYTVFGTIDEASVELVADIAADGNDNSNPAGGGAPNTPIDILAVNPS